MMKADKIILIVKIGLGYLKQEMGWNFFIFICCCCCLKEQIFNPVIPITCN